MRTLQLLEELIKDFHEEDEEGEQERDWVPMKSAMLGLQILLKYDPDGSTSAEHDVLYAGGEEPSAMDAADVAALKELGWNWSATEDSWVYFT